MNLCNEIIKKYEVLMILKKIFFLRIYFQNNSPSASQKKNNA